MRFFSYLMLAFTGLAMSDTVRIPGLEGPLAAEMVSVGVADHVVIIIPGPGPTDGVGNSLQTGLSADTYKLLAEGLPIMGSRRCASIKWVLRAVQELLPFSTM